MIKLPDNSVLSGSEFHRVWPAKKDLYPVFVVLSVRDLLHNMRRRTVGGIIILVFFHAICKTTEYQTLIF